MEKMLSLGDVVEGCKSFDVLDVLSESTYRDCSTVIVTPTRGAIHWKVVEAWDRMLRPVNQKRARLWCKGAEVGDAYNKFVMQALADGELSTYKYLLTLEDDNIVPPDAHMRLLDSIEKDGGYDAVGALYMRRVEPIAPLLLGDPSRFDATGEIESFPRDPREAIAKKQVVRVNTLPMGCTLYRMQLFRDLPYPWFETIHDYVVAGGLVLAERKLTQDAAFCEKALRAGKRLAVDCGLRVGHINTETGVVY